MDDVEKEKLVLFNKEYGQLIADIEKLRREDKDFEKEIGELMDFPFTNSEEKQKFIDSHPKIKKFQDRKHEIKRKYGIA